MQTKAYSYIRISSNEQRKGRGEERQLEAARAYAAQHNLELDDTHRDLGRSGYHGDHLKKGGHLGRFLDLVAQGKIAVGSYLIVENFDRLSRQAPIDAQAQFISILQAGIKIVTLMDGQVYERGRDFTQMIISLTIMSRGHEESARKSYNSKKNHDANRQDMLAGKPRFQSSCVGWIDQKQIAGSKDCRFSLNGHAKTVQRIFELADQGIGPLSIARILNETKTPPLKAIGTKWWENTVTRILKNETAIGTLQVHETVDGKLVPMGQPIRNYYPAAVTEELFWRVQRNKPKAFKTGRKGLRYANLFQTITRCLHCGGGLGLVQSTKNDYKYYRCKNRYQNKNCTGPSVLFPYNALEVGILDHVTDFYLDSQLERASGTANRTVIAEALAEAEGKLADLEKRARNTRNMSELVDDAETQAEYAVRLRELRIDIDSMKAEISEKSNQLREIDDKTSELTSVTDMIAAERKLWETGDESEIFVSRSKVAQAIRSFAIQVDVDFDVQAASVTVAGAARAYFFDRTGRMFDTWDGMFMDFEEIAERMRADDKSEAEIALAKSAYAKLKAAG